LELIVIDGCSSKYVEVNLKSRSRTIITLSHGSRQIIWANGAFRQPASERLLSPAGIQKGAIHGTSIQHTLPKNHFRRDLAYAGFSRVIDRVNSESHPFRKRI
jgi:hypothetical protein